MQRFGWARPFLREAAGLSLAGAAAQLIALLFSPAVLRRYGAQAFGVSAILIAVAGSLGQLSCLKYDLALLALPRGEEERPLVAAALVPIGLLALLLLGIGPLFGLATAEALLMALVMAAVGVYTVGSALCLRNLGPTHVASATVLRAGLQVTAQLGLHSWQNQSAALLLAYLISYLGGAIALLPGYFSAKGGAWKRCGAAAWQHREYPLLLLPGALVFSLALWLHQAVVLHYDPASLGCYAMVERLLGAPMTVLSAAVGQLFLRWISRLLKEERRTLYERVSLTMLALSAVACFVLYPAAAWIPRIFGEDWRDAVGILRALLPLFAVRFAVAPVASGLIAAGRRHALALWQLSMLLLTAGAGALAWWRDASLLVYLAFYGFLMSAGYLVLWSWGRNAIERKEAE